MNMNTNNDTTTNTTAPTPSGRKWPVMIVGLLLLNVAVCATTVTLSLRNPAAVEPDYYARGMSWDENRAVSDSTPATQDTESVQD